MEYLFLALGLTLLIKGADFLVRGASSVARSLKISEFVIGLTVVSFGTSLPELVISLMAGNEGVSDLAIGNVVGSNIANILLVLGVASIIYPMTATQGTVWREIPFTLVASLVLWVMLNDAFLDSSTESGLGHVDGIVLLGFFAVFIYYVAQIIKSDQNKEWVGPQAGDSLTRSIVEIVGGLIALVWGGSMAVDSAVVIARSWGMSDIFIGLTIIAIGTSLPELATSAMAAYRRNVDIAVGNIVGSNIFNIFIVLGISSLVHDIPFHAGNNIDMAVMVFATVLLFVFMFVGHPRKTIQRGEGAVFLAIYVLYTAYLVYRG